MIYENEKHAVAVKMTERSLAVRNRGGLASLLAALMAVVGWIEPDNTIGYIAKLVILVGCTFGIVYLAAGMYETAFRDYVKARNRWDELNGNRVDGLAVDPEEVNEYTL